MAAHQTAHFHICPLPRGGVRCFLCVLFHGTINPNFICSPHAQLLVHSGCPAALLVCNPVFTATFCRKGLPEFTRSQRVLRPSIHISLRCPARAARSHLRRSFSFQFHFRSRHHRSPPRPASMRLRPALDLCRSSVRTQRSRCRRKRMRTSPG